MKKFKFVYVPCTLSMPPEEWDLEYTDEDSVGCLVSKLRKHFDNVDFQENSKMTKQQLEEKNRAVNSAILDNLSQDVKVHTFC